MTACFAWFLRLITVVALFNILRLSFHLGISEYIGYFINLYQKLFYPMAEAILAFLKGFNISINKDVIVLFIVAVGLVLRACMKIPTSRFGITSLVAIIVPFIIGMVCGYFVHDNDLRLCFVISIPSILVLILFVSVIFDNKIDSYLERYVVGEYLLIFGACVAAVAINQALI